MKPVSMTLAIPATLAPRLYLVRTPEGISIPFEVARAGDRVAAFLLDFGLILLGSLAAGIVASFFLAPINRGLAIAFALLASFFLFNFYFVAWEVARSGVTPGKRRMGLRVISRDGGPLTADAVFARNLTRDLEVFLPLVALLSPAALVPAAPEWGKFLAIAWLLVFAALPLVSRDRLRCGDLVAGTLVVRAPASILLRDLAHVPEGSGAAHPADPAPDIVFTRQQLDIYGIHELQVLEDLLRRDDNAVVDPQLLAEVATKIKHKIDWPADRWQVPPRPFLNAFYRAQRGRLEQRLLFGERKERKEG
jgi:uncharacterized RDD family membrane protein YckC